MAHTLWHPWFAWRPVHIDHHWVWLRSIQRRWNPFSNFQFSDLTYRTPFAGGWEYRRAL